MKNVTTYQTHRTRYQFGISENKRQIGQVTPFVKGAILGMILLAAGSLQAATLETIASLILRFQPFHRPGFPTAFFTV